MNKIVEITISHQELSAIMQIVGQLPTQYGAGLYSFFVKKQQEAMQGQSHVASNKEESLTSEQEHG